MNKRLDFFVLFCLSPLIIGIIIGKIDIIWFLACVGAPILAYKVLEILYHLTKPPD